MRNPVVLTFVLLTVLTTSALAADKVRYAELHTVAIDSTLGDGLTMKRNADIFGPTAADVVIQTGAKLDGFVVEYLRASLKDRFTIVERSAVPAPDAIVVVHAATIELTSPIE